MYDSDRFLFRPLILLLLSCQVFTDIVSLSVIQNHVPAIRISNDFKNIEIRNCAIDAKQKSSSDGSITNHRYGFVLLELEIVVLRLKVFLITFRSFY